MGRGVVFGMATRYVHEYLLAIDHPLRSLGETFRAEYDFLLTQVSKGSLVLDVGCGAARPAKDIAPFVKEIACLDNDKHMLQLAMQRSVGVPNIRFVFGEAIKTDFSDNTYDFVYATYNLIGSISLSERFLLVQEMARVVKPNGKIFVATWKSDLQTTEFLKRYYPSIGITILNINEVRTETDKGIFDRISEDHLKEYFKSAGIVDSKTVELGPVWFGLLGTKK